MQSIGSASARVCGTCLESLSRASDTGGGEGAGDGCWVDLRAMGGAGGVGGMLGGLEWPSLGARGGRSSLAFFYRIRSGAVSLGGDWCLTPAPGLHRAGASHDLQYTRYFAYSDALGGSFFPGAVPLWSGLPSSVVSSGAIEEFKGLI